MSIGSTNDRNWKRVHVNVKQNNKLLYLTFNVPKVFVQ